LYKSVTISTNRKWLRGFKSLASTNNINDGCNPLQHICNTVSHTWRKLIQLFQIFAPVFVSAPKSMASLFILSQIVYSGWIRTVESCASRLQSVLHTACIMISHCLNREFLCGTHELKWQLLSSLRTITDTFQI